MSTWKHIDKICCIVIALSLLLTVLFMNGEALGIESPARALGYESRLFDPERVHTIDIVMDGWEGFLDTCENEEYAVCSVVIDGEASKNVGLRAKGNTSLSSASQMGGGRYSFKIEFDQYDSGKSYYGLDKLCLNNIVQDTTYMKDFLTYQMMESFGVDSPLCSFAYLTVNGEDWGLYLAVEGVEDGFLQRNYGGGHGELYKPDSMSLGGGRGNGREFHMDDFMEQGERPESQRESPDNQPPQFPGSGGFSTVPMPGGGFGGISASDVKLQYIDDNPESYSNIFDNAKTKITQTDQQRLIASLKSLSSYENLETILDLDEVLRYFVVHNFVVNGDSYTGNMVHNYYLYEKDGRLSMIPWDYNLAFGTFQAGSADSAVNDPIDEALTDRPMQAWIFSDEAYTERYHALFAEFLDTMNIEEIIDRAYTRIAPYVEKDPTKFCTYEEFETGVQTLKAFCSLRAQSVRGQLNGAIPSTKSAQSLDGAKRIDASGLTMSSMGTMGGAKGGPGGGDGFDFGGFPPEGGSLEQAPVSDRQEPASESSEKPFNRNDGFSQTGSTEGVEPPDSSSLNLESSAESAQMPEQGIGDRRGPLEEGGFLPSGAPETSNETAAQPLILLGISALVLLSGIVIAKKFRHMLL